VSLTFDQTVEFLKRIGLTDAEILDDAPDTAGLLVTAAGLRRLIALASDTVGRFAVRDMLADAERDE